METTDGHFLAILIIEDSESDYIIVRDLLHDIYQQQVEIKWAETYEDGLREVQHGSYSLVLLDYHLGEHTQNLIANAIKFHREDEPPRIKVYLQPGPESEPPVRAAGPELELAQNRDDMAYYQICVEDNGIGFDEKYGERIFSPFQRLHSQQKYEGTGIGLAVCRKIVERHGGSIIARSTPGQGSLFTITLPRYQPEEITAP